MEDLQISSNEPITHNVSKVSLTETSTSDDDSDEETEKCQTIISALTDEEKEKMIDTNMPLRYLRAEKGNSETAIIRLKESIAWQEEFKVHSIKKCFEEGGDSELKDIISFENATGKIYCRGYDKGNRAILYLRPARENSTDGTNNMRHLVYNLEKAIACTLRKSKGTEGKVNIIIDYKDFRLRDTPPMSTTKMTLNILQNHYPERLHKGYICNPPYVFVAFWKMIQPFLDPVTKNKVVFCRGDDGTKSLGEDMDLTVVEESIGGCNNGKEFDSKEYLHCPFNKVFDEN